MSLKQGKQTIFKEGKPKQSRHKLILRIQDTKAGKGLLKTLDLTTSKRLKMSTSFQIQFVCLNKLQ